MVTAQATKKRPAYTSHPGFRRQRGREHVTKQDQRLLNHRNPLERGHRCHVSSQGTQSPVQVMHSAMSLPLVCDYGSGFSKVGFSGAEAPLAVFPTILGKLRHDNPLVGTEKQDWFIGDEAQNRRDRLSMLCPISRATVTSWDNMEKIWHHSFYQVLRIAPEQHPMMVTDPPLNAASNKEKVLQVRAGGLAGREQAAGRAPSGPHLLLAGQIKTPGRAGPSGILAAVTATPEGSPGGHAGVKGHGPGRRQTPSQLLSG
ncbi:actin-like protein 7A [Pteropus medius]|uniref:actin-like protein 7A n=1 Tax=Pteropus vampyrus TaxID=132908 RepID=UPI00196A24A1|nr:actin-like protein 7A [Pteropus giganteus]